MTHIYCRSHPNIIKANMQIDQTAERPVAMTHTDHQGGRCSMQELSPGGQSAPTGGAPLSQKLGPWLASAAAVVGASPASPAVLRMSD